MPFLWLRLVQMMFSGEFVRLYDRTGYYTAKIIWVGFDYVEILGNPHSEQVTEPTKIVVPFHQIESVYQNSQLSRRESLERMLNSHCGVHDA
jgi:hypothetical protein